MHVYAPEPIHVYWHACVRPWAHPRVLICMCTPLSPSTCTDMHVYAPEPIHVYWYACVRPWAHPHRPLVAAGLYYFVSRVHDVPNVPVWSIQNTVMYPVNWLFGYNGNLPLKDTSPTDRALIQETTVEPYRPTNVFVQFIRHRVVRFSPISPKKSVRLWGYLTVCPPFPNLKEPTDIRWDLWRTLCYWKTHLSRLLNNFYKKNNRVGTAQSV